MDWLTDWLTDSMNVWKLIDSDWLTDWLTDMWTDSLNDWLNEWLINLLIHGLTDWLTIWLMYSLIDWCIDWWNKVYYSSNNKSHHIMHQIWMSNRNYKIICGSLNFFLQILIVEENRFFQKNVKFPFARRSSGFFFILQATFIWFVLILLPNSGT